MSGERGGSVRSESVQHVSPASAADSVVASQRTLMTISDASVNSNNNNNNNNNAQDDIYCAVIMTTRSLREFTRFI